MWGIDMMFGYKLCNNAYGYSDHRAKVDYTICKFLQQYHLETPYNLP